MSAELSYMQLKAANDAREAEEVRVEQRKRNLLVLILHYLREEGFLDSVAALTKEAGSSVAKYTLCDNVDLSAILQEYESYYFIKFKKAPKITKRATPSASRSTRVSKSKQPSNRSTEVPSLPPILSTSTGDPLAATDKKGKRPSSADRKRSRKNAHASDSQASSSSPNVSVTGHEELGLRGSAIRERKTSRSKEPAFAQTVTMKGLLQHAIADASADIPDTQERLLKPVAGFTGYSSEMRELAAVISRDIYLENPDVHWDDIIGLDTAKRLVKEAVVYPIKYPQLFTGILAPWKGLLLYGPPGTGKTMLAKAVATECKTTFFNISASSIVSKWRGDSEKLVRVLFELARFHAPSTIFMDELESIMGQRDAAPGSEHEGSRRMKTELLVQMDGLARSNDLVFVLAASNLPWELDYGMLRRLEKRILVDLPIKSARSAMFLHHLPPTISQPPLNITTHIDYSRAAELTEGYSGSDIKLVCKEAVMRSVRKVFHILENLSDEYGVEGVVMDPVTMNDIEETVANTKPSARLLASRYTQWQKEYESI